VQQKKYTKVIKREMAESKRSIRCINCPNKPAVAICDKCNVYAVCEQCRVAFFATHMLECFETRYRDAIQSGKREAAVQLVPSMPVRIRRRLTEEEEMREVLERFRDMEVRSIMALSVPHFPAVQSGTGYYTLAEITSLINMITSDRTVLNNVDLAEISKRIDVGKLLTERTTCSDVPFTVNERALSRLLRSVIPEAPLSDDIAVNRKVRDLWRTLLSQCERITLPLDMRVNSLASIGALLTYLPNVKYAKLDVQSTRPTEGATDPRKNPGVTGDLPESSTMKDRAVKILKFITTTMARLPKLETLAVLNDSYMEADSLIGAWGEGPDAPGIPTAEHPTLKDVIIHDSSALMRYMAHVIPSTVRRLILTQSYLMFPMDIARFGNKLQVFNVFDTDGLRELPNRDMIYNTEKLYLRQDDLQMRDFFIDHRVFSLAQNLKILRLTMDMDMSGLIDASTPVVPTVETVVLNMSNVWEDQEPWTDRTTLVHVSRVFPNIHTFDLTCDVRANAFEGLFATYPMRKLNWLAIRIVDTPRAIIAVNRASAQVLKRVRAVVSNANANMEDVRLEHLSLPWVAEDMREEYAIVEAFLGQMKMARSIKTGHFHVSGIMAMPHAENLVALKTFGIAGLQPQFCDRLKNLHTLVYEPSTPSFFSSSAGIVTGPLPSLRNLSLKTLIINNNRGKGDDVHDYFMRTLSWTPNLERLQIDAAKAYAYFSAADYMRVCPKLHVAILPNFVAESIIGEVGISEEERMMREVFYAHRDIDMSAVKLHWSLRPKLALYYRNDYDDSFEMAFAPPSAKDVSFPERIRHLHGVYIPF
jgi:hypothetical protein